MDRAYKQLCIKLLDTGKRNKLINFSSSMRSVEVLSCNPNNLFEDITLGNEFNIFNIDKEIPNLKAELAKKDISRDDVINEYSNKSKNNQLLMFSEEHTLDSILNNIKRVNKNFLDEQGINVLYLVIGFLNWKEKKKGDILKSPLILIPVKLDYVKSKYILSEFSDEISINPTLVYKLKNENNFDLAVFKDEESEDETVEEYLERVDDQVKDKGWHVSNDIYLSTFSYLKANMFEDLMTHEEEVMNNPLARKLLGKEADEFIYSDINIDNNSELDIHNVVECDSSQMEAIIRSTKGESFVLQGPPGTGKSQTITNIIAENLYLGKKILFVSEKLAALKVVYRNLESVNLAKYCLELHSNKTNKKTVLAEFKNILESPKETISDEKDRVLADYKKNKLYLDNYIKDLITPIKPIDLTIYELICRTIKYQQYSNFTHVIKNISSKNLDYYEDAVTALKTFESFSESIGYDYKKNNLYGINIKSLDYEQKIQFLEDLKCLYSYIDKNNLYIGSLNDELKLKINCFKKEDEYLGFIEAISKLTEINKTFFDKENLRETLNLTKDYLAYKASYDESYKIIGEDYRIDIYENDLSQLYNDFVTKYKSGFRFLNKEYRLINNKLKSYQKNPKNRIKYPKLVEILKHGKNKQTLQNKLTDLKDLIINNLSLHLVPNTNIENLSKELELLYNNFPTNYKTLANKGYDYLINIRDMCKDFVSFYHDTTEERSVKDRVQLSFDEHVVNTNEEDFVNLFKKLEKCINDFDYIDNFVSFNNLLSKLSILDLMSFVDKTINQNIERSEIHLYYTYLFFNQWSNFAVNSKAYLKNFTRAEIEEFIQKFKKNDLTRLNINKALISSKMSKGIPNIQTAIKGSQLSDLMREISKKTKHKPLRKLLKDDTEVIQELKPCFMMSPLSISTYITSDSCHFDLVIFDEASQVFPEDALGAIYRSSQVIVVGDSKQMPPTNFFNTTYDDDVYDEESQDKTAGFESILDLSSSIFLESKLRWHYRSQAESLIAFSNKEFYDNTLITFPESSPYRKDYGNRLVYVEDGVFDRVRRRNKAEAEMVVKLVFEQVKNYPDRTLGVVAFSIAQAELIEDLIYSNPQAKKLENLKNNDLYPFFVKNLETVQGDERDTIIFSLAYAKDSTGHFINNFGPLNKDGGERRLNVAVTRAKCQNIVVTSMKSSDISNDLSIGGKSLKDYLAYLENNEIELNTGNEEVSDYLIEDVYNEIISAGYNAKKNVGLSSNKVDIAVCDKHGNYILAIESDGQMYQSLKTTTERNRLKQMILEKYGWSTYHIYSISWFKNKEIEKKKLFNLISLLLTSPKEFLDEDIKVKDNFIKTEKKQISDVYANLNEAEQEIVFEKYIPYRIDKLGLVGTELFKLIDKEGPITFDLLAIKCVELFRRKENDEDYQKLLKINIRKMNDRIFKVEDYYITDKNKEIKLRVPRRESEERDVNLISIAELASGVLVLVKNNVSIEKKNLYQALARYLGYQRVGSNITARFDEVIEYLKNKELINEIDDFITINKMKNE